jgi:hypothetical protein
LPPDQRFLLAGLRAHLPPGFQRFPVGASARSRSAIHQAECWSVVMLPREITQTQRRHPIAWSSLLLALIVPLAVGVTALGLLLKHLFPVPTPLQIAVGASVMISAIPLLMFLGAAIWLVVARRFVARSVAMVFFVYPGMGVFSRISEWMFLLAYGVDDA